MLAFIARRDSGRATRLIPPLPYLGNDPDDAERLPEGAETVVCGILLPRLAVAGGAEALSAVLAALLFPPATLNLRHDPCSQARRHKSNGSAGTLRPPISAPGALQGRLLIAMQQHSQTPGKALARGLRMVMMAPFRAVQPGTRRRGLP